MFSPSDTPTGALVHVRIAARDPRRAASFYADCFGWRAVGEDAAGVRFEAPGGLQGRFWSGGEPCSAGPELYVAVQGIDEAVRRALARGAVRIARVAQDASGARVALLLDTEGNRIGLWEPPQNLTAIPTPSPRGA